VKAVNAFILIASLALISATVNAAEEKPADKPAANPVTNAASFNQPKSLAELLATTRPA